MAEYGRIWQIAVRLPQIAVRLLSRGRSLVVESVETGGRVQGVTGVSRNTKTIKDRVRMCVCIDH